MTNADPLLLPPGARLLYIGPPKTGTTSLQMAAQQARDELYELGVYYPGDDVNHRREVFAFMRRPDHRAETRPRGVFGKKARRIPPKSEWDALMADIDSEPDRRILISHESISRASTETAREFIEATGPDRTPW